MTKIKSLNDVASIAAYMGRIGAEPRSLRTMVVKEMQGKYWRDIAVIYVDQDGTVKAPQGMEPTDNEASLIKSECASVTWPQLKPTKNIMKAPAAWKGVDPENLFYFHSSEGHIIMVQQRINDSDGGKAYVPWTFWDDDEWRMMEPEGKLPFWGADQLNDHATVFIHEGAKAARHVRRMVEGKTPEDRRRLKEHPWGEELAHAAHIGWIGGALSPSRTDWSLLKKLGIKRAYIVSDNDEPGVAAVPAIAFQLRLPTFHVQFTSEWPTSFDLADEFPKKMFKKTNGATYYIGPSFRSCLHPATWATDQIPNAKGKPTTVLREEFKNMWAYVEEADMFVCKEMPEILRPETIVNKMLAAFSHTNNTAMLMVRAYRGRNTKLCYRPDILGRVVTDKTTSAVNLHTPTHIKSVPGDAGPWLEFLAYLFPQEEERKQVMRWCATLIARPDIKMHYGMLLVSETQGIGKTTLGANILAPLVGDHNVGFPSESDIVDSPFNGWVANKRLIIIGEIYSGHSWKAYNKLKSYITDKDIEFNQKYQKAYRVENWAHVLASSNSRKALKMEEKDRRWFYPMITEVKWPREKFHALHEWLSSGGIQIIRHWAEQYGDYVAVGEQAPMTELKKQMIKDSRSEAAQDLADLCEAVAIDGIPVTLAMKDITSWIRARHGARQFDTDYELRKTAVDTGFVVYDKRIKIGSQMQYVLLSPAFVTANPELKSSNLSDGEKADIIRRMNKAPGELMQDPM